MRCIGAQRPVLAEEGEQHLPARRVHYREAALLAVLRPYLLLSRAPLLSSLTLCTTACRLSAPCSLEGMECQTEADCCEANPENDEPILYCARTQAGGSGTCQQVGSHFHSLGQQACGWQQGGQPAELHAPPSSCVAGLEYPLQHRLGGCTFPCCLPC